MNRKMMTLLPLLLAALVLAGCGKKDFNRVQALAFQEEEDGKWGLVKPGGELVLKPKFDGTPTCMVNDRFFVWDMDKEAYTLYDKDGKALKKNAFKEVTSFLGDITPVLDLKDNIKYIDRDGNEAFPLKKLGGKKVMEAGAFIGGRSMVRNEDDKWGFINEKGELVIPCKYADVGQFVEGKAVVYFDPRSDEDGKWGVIDRDGNVLFKKNNKDCRPGYLFIDGFLSAEDKKGRSMFLNEKGETVAKLKEHVSPNIPYDGLFAAYNSNKSKYGLMNMEGEWVLRDKYAGMQFNGKLLVVCDDEDSESFRLINTAGDEIAELPEGYAYVFDFGINDYTKYMFVGEWNRGFTIVDSKGKEVKTKFDIYNFSQHNPWSVSVPVEEVYDWMSDEELELEEPLEPYDDDYDPTVDYD